MTTPEEWRCPQPGCDLGVDGHDFGLAIAHCMEIDEKEAQDVADRVLNRLAEQLEEGR